MMRAIALLVAVAALLGGQSPRARTLVVSVADPAGVRVSGLTPHDFDVTIGGTRVPVMGINESPEPVSVMVLFDRSPSAGSVRFDPRSPFAGAGQQPLLEANTVGDALLRRRRPVDREYVGRFSGFTEFRGPVKPEMGEWQDVLAWALALVPGSSSPIWDVASQAAKRIESDPGRKVVVLVTDGRSNANVLSLEDAAREIVRSGVAISVIDIGYREQVWQADKLVAVPRPDRLLAWLAEATGGHYVGDPAVIKSRVIPPAILGNIVELHRQAYGLRVDVPSGTAPPQSVKVTVNRPGAVARTAAFIEVR